MSGGSYDYAYSKLHELDRWVSTLEQMATACKVWAASDQANEKYVKRPDTNVSDRVPSTLQDRACILVRGMLLERAAARLKRAVDEVRTLERLMHDVEWVDSCDYSVSALMGPVEPES